MASTKEMQQRAKQLRQQAKEDLKPKLSIEILAIRHQKNGLPEFTQFAVEKVKPINDKNRLLAAICKNKWGHKPPYNYIAEYLIQTNSFKMFDLSSALPSLAIISVNSFQIKIYSIFSSTNTRV